MGVEQNLDQLLFRNEPLVFLVGAGISIPSPSNMISGQVFLEGIINRMSPEEIDPNIGKVLQELCKSERYNRLSRGDFLRFEGLMQILQETVDSNLDILNRLGECNRPNENHYLLAQLIQKGHYVFTTNFDHLIELAFDQPWECTPLIYDGEFQQYSAQRNSLFKLHGSLKRYNGKEWVNSRNSVLSTLEAVGKGGMEMLLEPGKRKVMTSILQRHDLVIIGYSGYDDFDIGPMLRSIQSNRRVTWINHNPRIKNVYSWCDLAKAYEGDKKALAKVLEGEKGKQLVDKNGDFMRSRYDCLYTMGLPNIRQPEYTPRNPEKISVFNLDTVKAVRILMKRHGIHSPRLGDDYHFDKESFLNEWVDKHIPNNGYKYSLCAKVFLSLGRHSEALLCYQKSSEIFGRINDKKGMSITFSGVAAIHQIRGEHDKALEFCQQSLAIGEELYDAFSVSQCLHNIGLAYHDKGEYGTALEYYKRCLSMFDKVGDQVVQAKTLQYIGMIYHDRGDYEIALENYQKSADILNRLGDIVGIGRSLHNIGSIYSDRGEYDKALEYYEKSVALKEKINDMIGVARSLRAIGRIQYERKKFNEALQKFKQSFTLAEAVGNRSEISANLHAIGMVYQVKNEHDKALEHYRKSLEIRENLGEKLDIALTCAQIGALLTQTKVYESAIQYFLRAKSIFKELGSRYIVHVKRDLDSIRAEIGEDRFRKYLDQLQ